MTDVTQQLADALREAYDALRLHVDWEADLIMSELEVDGVPAPTQNLWDKLTDNVQQPRNAAMDKAKEALTTFEASRAAPDDVVERVAYRFDHALNVALVAEALLKGFWFSDERQAVRAARAALSAIPARVEGTRCFECDTELHGPYCPKCAQADDALEGLRELMDEHDKAHGETKYTPAKQPPYAMTMDGLHRQTFAAMYAYVRAKLAAPARGEE